jgi:hypothetical protein
VVAVEYSVVVQGSRGHWYMCNLNLLAEEVALLVYRRDRVESSKERTRATERGRVLDLKLGVMGRAPGCKASQYL